MSKGTFSHCAPHLVMTHYFMTTDRQAGQINIHSFIQYVNPYHNTKYTGSVVSTPNTLFLFFIFLVFFFFFFFILISESFINFNVQN